MLRIFSDQIQEKDLMLCEPHLWYIVMHAIIMLARREYTGNMVFEESSTGTLDF